MATPSLSHYASLSIVVIGRGMEEGIGQLAEVGSQTIHVPSLEMRINGFYRLLFTVYDLNGLNVSAV